MIQPPPSPVQPVAPPSKKQRASSDAPLRGGGRDSITTDTNDAIARRRAELRKLQAKRGGVQTNDAGARGSTKAATSTEGLLEQARNQLSAGGGVTAPGASNGGAPHPAEQRHSQDFLPQDSKPTKPLVESTPSAIQLATQPPKSIVTKGSARKVVRNLDPAFAAKVPPPEDGQSKPDHFRPKSAPPMRPPPPPVPSKLSAEAPPIVESSKRGVTNRPPPITPGLAGSEGRSNRSSSSGREMLRNLRDSADSLTHKQTTELRLLKELKKTQQEKDDAFRKVQRLQDQVAQMNKQESRPHELQTILQLADKKGEAAAVEWARSQLSNGKTRSSALVGFMSPMAAPVSRGIGTSLAPLNSHPLRKRVATPHPKREQHHDDNERDFLKEATNATPDEYYSTLATYVIRRPYTPSTDPILWSIAGVLDANEYQVNADAYTPSSIEVAAKIAADGSILTLSDDSTARHKKANSTEWRNFCGVDQMEKPMGCVMYIDGDANEKEYWLDEIYEEALSTRETYCSSLIATASALRKNPGPAIAEPQIKNVSRDAVELVEEPKPKIIIQEVERQRPETLDAGVDTSDLPVIEEDRRVHPEDNSKDNANHNPKDNSKDEGNVVAISKALPPMDDDNASDVLSVMLGSMFSAIFSLVWFVFIRIPIRIVSFTFVLTATCAILTLAWLYLSEDNGFNPLGAQMPYQLNNGGLQ